MKDDGRLKSLGILLAMIAVIVAFFSMFLKREPMVVKPSVRTSRPAESSAASAAPPSAPSATP